jgi:hypothetical protein
MSPAPVRTVPIANAAISHLGAPTPPRSGSARSLVLAATLLATGVIFGLPHLLIPHLLGPSRPYTPFAISGVSSVTFDETFAYAAYVNYTSRRQAPPYDTDVFESRDVPVPTATVPYFALAALAGVVGGVERVFVSSDFVLPPLAVLLLYLLIREIGGSRPIALLGSLATILIPFGPRNFLGVPLALALRQGGSVVQPLEYSRLLHPELSFTLMAAALLLLWHTLHRGGRVEAALGGLAGGLLFYTYFYYFPIWFGACALLLFARPWLSKRVWIAMWVANVSTWLVSVPFWLSFLGARETPNFSTRLERHYSDLGHVPSPEKLAYTFAYVVTFAILVSIFLRFGQRAAWQRKILLFHAALFAAAIAALNLEVMLGFNLEALNHYTNRFIHPFLVLTAFTLVAAQVRWSAQMVAAWAYAAVGILLTIAVTRQALVSINVANRHELAVEYRLLFDWLNAHTQLDDVVLASGKEVNDLIPVFTHNRVFVPNGERTSVNDAEIERRFLIAMRLLQLPEREVHDLLAKDHRQGDQPLGLTYTYFLFVSGYGSYNLGLPASTIERILAEYRQLDVARELEKRRVNYVYASGVERPATVPGWNLRRMYGNPYGNVWRIEPT